MRYAKKDTSHDGIRRALEAAGCSVQSLAALGHGVPDLMACRASRIYLFECKTPKASKHKETEASQRSWAEQMGIRVHIVKTPEEAIAALHQSETRDT